VLFRSEGLGLRTDKVVGHDEHSMDIWPPVEDVTAGSNWPMGEPVYLHGCSLMSRPETALSNAVLPSTGQDLSLGGAMLLSAVLVATGLAVLSKWIDR